MRASDAWYGPKLLLQNWIFSPEIPQFDDLVVAATEESELPVMLEIPYQ